MNSFFDLTINTSSNIGFEKFSIQHFVWIAVCIALIIASCVLYTRSAAGQRRKWRSVLGLIVLGFELLRAGLLYAKGEYNLGTLPLHLCGMAVYIVAFHALRGGETAAQFLFAFCMPGAAAAILFPDWSYYPMWHFITVSGFIIHALIVGYTLMLVFARELMPRLRGAGLSLLIMLPLAGLIFIFNKFAFTNYMFLNWPAAGTPLELFAFLGNPGYLLAYIPLIAIIWFFMYLPFVRKRK